MSSPTIPKRWYMMRWYKCTRRYQKEALVSLVGLLTTESDGAHNILLFLSNLLECREDSLTNDMH